MKYTIYHAQYRALRLINAIDFEQNKDQLTILQSFLENLNHFFLDETSMKPVDITMALAYRQKAIEIYQQQHFLLKKKHRDLTKSICMSLVCFAQKIEFLSESANLNKFQQKLDSLIHQSHLLSTIVLRPLCQQSSVYLAGHRGICAIAAKEWLASNFMRDDLDTSQIYSENYSASFIKTVQFNKEELFFLYAREKANKKSTLTFSLVTGLLRLSNGGLILALLDELSENKNVCFLITFAHFKHRLFHSVGCKFSQELIQWFDADCGIFQSKQKENFHHWLDFYLKENRYTNKFSFFNVQIGQSAPELTDTLLNGVKYMRHLY